MQRQRAEAERERERREGVERWVMASASAWRAQLAHAREEQTKWDGRIPGKARMPGKGQGEGQGKAECKGRGAGFVECCI